MSRRGVSLKVGTLNFSWQANAIGMERGARTNIFSKEYFKSARAILDLKSPPQVLLVQEMSINKQHVDDKGFVPVAVEETLFGGAYKCVAHRFIEVYGTSWFGSMVLVSSSLASSYTFTDVGNEEHGNFNRLCYSDYNMDKEWPFSIKGGRLLAAAVMADKRTGEPVMLLCSAHSEHKRVWDKQFTEKVVDTVVSAAMEEYKAMFRKAPNFDKMGVVFGGDLNTTHTRKCSWGGPVTLRALRATLHKVPGYAANFKTLRGENHNYPRDWIFSTQGNPGNITTYRNTGSDHYLVMAQTQMKCSPRAQQNDDTLMFAQNLL